ncbi:Ig-like domain-containing protein [Brumimicrobium aurantiacum]|uniref:SbsA Ig-like domain-containing protein n=1 Tax=Brumimicrobium aurantiacum TaxID=1737063 RepID=A0A3E1F287_9FLAO|nr:Ig-like domain-containing protein [Brumimicrobium aurantiacum]RFC55931.1 hypothetical protein DXU93_03045 [Brumimicrobium aurantiacum]
MARFNFIILLLSIYLVSGCGQVGTITGGPVDVTAPRVITDKVQPPNASTEIYPESILIPFDEFISFNKPAENIRVTPDDVKLDYKIKGKSVELKVESGEWKPNTTYTIYLNRAVKDITEQNDSIISYVFSTGEFIDSLQTGVQVNDAYTGKPVTDVTVGLFTERVKSDTSKIEPRYYASTNDKGIAIFRYIKDTTFYLYAFEDENLNNRIDATEKRAALFDPVKLDTLFETGPIIRLMPTRNEALTIQSNEALPTATWGIGFSRELRENESFEFLPVEPLQIIWNEDKDSLSAFYGQTDQSGVFSGILKADDKNDTIIKRFFFKNEDDLALKLTDNIINNSLWANDTLKLKSNEPFKSFDQSMVSFKAIAEDDTVQKKLDYELVDISPIEKALVFDKRKIDEVFLTIPPHAVSGINYPLKDSVEIDFSPQKDKETGVMIVEFDTIPEYGILVVENKEHNFKQELVFDGVEKVSHRIEYLQPGSYSFYYIYDENKDGEWTTGSIFDGVEAEKVAWFTTKSTIRANWEVKTVIPIKLVKNDEKEQSTE